MKVKFHSVNFTADIKLLDFIQRKLDKIHVFYDKVVSINVYLKVESSSDKINKLSEIKLNIPGKDLIVKKTSNSFEGSIVQCVEVLTRSLLRHKNKMNELV
jgi:putative sigma-54 modulation protein